MKKRILIFFAAIVLVTIIGFNLSLGLSKKSIDSINLLSLTQSAEACEIGSPSTNVGKCIQLSHICVFTHDFRDCDPFLD
ncbi:hypothetical protein KCV26_13930 [Petrimonas sulfuriphila]|jgi:hypothetical protein|uniref:hypothetical protein n=1 Tax=Petrimonas sulfuriphila TaxID=285070 RepID=UPI003243A6D5